MRIYDIAQKQATSLPGYEIIDMFEAAFPVYRLNVLAIIVTEQTIPVIEEYILKLISEGIRDIDIIKGILGLPDNLIKDYVVNLLSQELVSHSPKRDAIDLDITLKGKNALTDLKLSKPVEVTLPLIYDASTGVLEYHKAALGLYDAKHVKDMGIEIIRPYMKKPYIEDIDTNFVRGLYKKMRGENPEMIPGDLVDVLSVEKSWVEYKKMRVLAFYSQDEQDVIVKVFDRTEMVADYGKVIMRMERDGITVLPSSGKEDIVSSDLLPKIGLDFDDLKRNTNNIEKVKDKRRILTKQIPVEKNDEDDLDIIENDFLRATTSELQQVEKEIERLHNEDRILSTYEHRPILEKALSEAKKQVVIISPWIRADAMDNELISKIDKALQRKVEVVIGYGISQDTKHKDTRPLDRLNKLKEKVYGKYLQVKRLGNTHEKVLVCDTQFAVITSFNWMSFKGSPTRGFRQETGFLFHDEKNILKLMEDVKSRFNENSG